MHKEKSRLQSWFCVGVVVLLCAWRAAGDNGEWSGFLEQVGRDFSAEYWLEGLDDAATMVTAPLGWESGDWLVLGTVSGIAVSLYALDESIQDLVQDNRTDLTQLLSDVGKPFGDGRYTLPGLAGLYAYGYYMGDERANRTALFGLESMLLSGSLVQVIKYATHRRRPRDGDDAWYGPGFEGEHFSFPSGHGQMAFCLATVVSEEYGDIPCVMPTAYTLAALTAFSRVHDNAHWASDVFVGAAIGHFTTRAVLWLNGYGHGNGPVTTVPVVGEDWSGLAVVREF